MYCAGPKDCNSNPPEVMITQPTDLLQRIDLKIPMCEKDGMRYEIYVGGSLVYTVGCHLFFSEPTTLDSYKTFRKKND